MKHVDAYDDEWDDDDERGRRWPLVLAVLLVAVVAIVVGPRVLARFDDDASEPLDLVPTSESVTGSLPDDTAPTPSTAPTDPSAPATTTGDAAVMPSTGVVALQMVPAVRDVIVRVDGTELTSDGRGVIALPPGQRSGTIEFVGVTATPALIDVELAAWSDGETSPTRALDALAGPIVQIGLTVSANVRITLDDPALAAAQVEFWSEDGPVTFQVDTPQWVPSRRAIQSSDGFVVRTLTYASNSLTLAGVETPLPYEEYRALPESIWAVTTQ